MMGYFINSDIVAPRTKSRANTRFGRKARIHRAILSDEIMLQKLTYLHNNPVTRGLVASPEHWRYSSAHEWLPGGMPLLRCDEWR